MLRWVLGDSVFYSSIRSYISDPGLIYSYAKTDDLKRHLETVSGKDLSDFLINGFMDQVIHPIIWNGTNRIMLLI